MILGVNLYICRQNVTHVKANVESLNEIVIFERASDCKYSRPDKYVDLKKKY